jgi:biofilm PGA synthesis N-glycosyltransferase PgaC
MYPAVLAVVCLLQFGTSLIIKRRYEEGLARQFFWVIW